MSPTLGLITGLVEQCEHAFLICLDTGLIKRIDTQHISAHTASFFKEIDKLTEIILGNGWQLDLHIGNPAIDMRDLRTQLGHFIHGIDTPTGQEIQPIEIFLVSGNRQFGRFIPITETTVSKIVRSPS